MDWGDARAQALQVGAVLLLGVIVIALSLYQVTVVPQENKEVEFNDYLEGSADMTDLHNDILASGQRGVQSGTTVQTGTNYPARALFINPPPASGRLETSSPRNVTFSGVVAVEGEPTDVRGVWNGTGRNYSTQAIVFRPAYSELRVSPVVVSSGTVYRNTDDGPLPLTEQSLVNGKRLSLVTVNGTLSTGGYAATVAADPASASARTVTVTGDGSTFNVTLRFGSSAAAAAWNGSSVADQYRTQQRVVTTTHPAGEAYVNVTLDGTETYELRLARVSVREASDETTVDDPAPEYIFPTSGNNSKTTTEEPSTLTAEVRDRYNNPVSGVNVTFTTTDGTFEETGTGTRNVTTTDDGRASVTFVSSETDSVVVRANFSRNGAHNTTTFELTSVPPGSDASSLVVLDQIDGTDGSDQISFVLDHQASEQRNATGIRLNYVTQFSQNGEIQDGPTEITEVSLNGTTNSVSALEGNSPWFFAENGQTNPTLGTNTTEQLTVTVDSTYQIAKDKEAVPVSITVYYEGGIVGTYAVWLGV